jgi:hypothetical protein
VTEAENLPASLPEELRPPLERSRDRRGGKAQRMSLAELPRGYAEALTYPR